MKNKMVCEDFIDACWDAQIETEFSPLNNVQKTSGFRFGHVCRFGLAECCLFAVCKFSAPASPEECLNMDKQM